MPRAALLHLPLALLALAPGLPAQSRATNASLRRSAPEWRAVLEEGKKNSAAMAHLDHLTNRIGPRLTSSDNLQIACEWARDYFSSLGLDARLEQWGSFPVGFNRGPWSGSITSPEGMRQELRFCTNAWSAGTKGKQQGHALRMPGSLEEAKKQRQELAGAWILGSFGGRRRYAKDALELRRYLEKQGVLGFIQPSRSKLLVTFGSSRVSWDKLPVTPRITLDPGQFKAIEEALAVGTEVELSFDIRNHFKKGPIPLYNVIADLKGAEEPDEYVIVSGHLDSWDGATGTTDNGTGAASTIEAARILAAAGVQPRRTIRFILWSGEEQGLLGSRGYVTKHRKDCTDKVSACFVHDGGTNYVSGLAALPSQMPILEKAFADFSRVDTDYPFKLREITGGAPGSSDHASFWRARVPGFYWSQSGEAVYRRTWHTQKDTYDAAIPEYQKHSSTVIALAALAVANLPELLPRLTQEEIQQLSGGRGQRLGVQTGEGLRVLSVSRGSIAEAAGVKPGDVLVSLDGRKLKGQRRNLIRA
ncbi:MAG: M20/M25/M40 family metallo-hydrolase, partial [Planctomycetota bacterium]